MNLRMKYDTNITTERLEKVKTRKFSSCCQRSPFLKWFFFWGRSSIVCFPSSYYRASVSPRSYTGNKLQLIPQTQGTLMKLHSTKLSSAMFGCTPCYRQAWDGPHSSSSFQSISSLLQEQWINPFTRPEKEFSITIKILRGKLRHGSIRTY